MLLLGYVALEVTGAVLLAALALRGFGLSGWGRVLAAVFAALSLGQAVYLVFFFGGGPFRMTLWPLAGPIWAIVRMVRHTRATRADRRARANQLWGPAGAPTFLAPDSPSSVIRGDSV